MPLLQPWNNWYHCSGHTYGSWLRGDPRGWRARNHREHVEGDYRNPPPPGAFDELYEQSKESMKRDPVVLSPESRTIACEEMVASLERHESEVIAAAVTSRHFHILARIRDRRARHYIGIAKKDASRKLSDLGVVDTGGIWAKRSKSDPIRNREHQINAVWYILEHLDKGAAIWAPDAILARFYEKRNKCKRSD